MIVQPVRAILTVMLAVCVFLFCGCAPPMKDPGKSAETSAAKQSPPAANQSTLVANQSDPPPEPENVMPYAGGNADVNADTVPADLLNRLKPLLPSSDEVNAALLDHIEELRSENVWLDESLRKPVSTSLLTDEGKNPGPNTHQQIVVSKGLADELLEDYLRYSDDTDEDKKQMSELYEKNIVELLEQRDPDYETQCKIFAKFEAGDIDPLVLFLNLSNHTLYDTNRRNISAKVPAGLRSRTCSSTTFLKLIELTSMKTGVHSDGEMDWMAKSVFTMLPDFLRRRKPDEPYSSYSHAMVVELRDKLRAKGELEFMRLILKLRDDEPEIVPDALFHSCLFDFYWSISRKARGGAFINETSEERLETFEHYANLATPHGLAAYLADSDNPFLAKNMLNAELVASLTPLSTQQWYRVAMLTQSDSAYSAKQMSWSLMPRYGGSRDEVRQFLVRLIEQGTGAEDNQLAFVKAMDRWMADEGWLSNIAEYRELYGAVTKLADHFYGRDAENLDNRVTGLAIAMILRVLWDAGDIERFSQLLDTYEGSLSDNFFTARYIPPEIACLVYQAYRTSNAPQQAIVDLQQELICGDEKYSDQRWQNIRSSIAELRTAVDSVEQPNEEGEVGSGVAKLAELLDVMNGLHETISSYHNGEQVDLLTENSQWTAFGNGYRGNVVSVNASTIDIQAHCRNATLVFSQPLRFEQPFDVELDVQQLSCDADPYGIALFAGQVARGSSDSDWSGRSLRYSPGYPMIMQDLLPAERLRGEFYHEERLVPVPEKATLRMEVRDENVKSFLNGRLITDFEYPINTGGYVQFGRKAGDGFTGVPDKSATYKVSGIRIRKRP